MRQLQTFANAGSSFTFPKRNDDYRIVSLYVQAISMTAGSAAQVAIIVNDGAGNPVAAYASPPVAFGNVVQIVTFSSSADFSAAAVANGGLLNVAIPDDLWIKPNWTALVQWAPVDVSQVLGQLNLQVESFPKTSIDKSVPVPQGQNN